MIKPILFDILGIPVFVLLFIIGIRLRKKARIESKILIIISVFGFIMDSYNILNSFVLN